MTTTMKTGPDVCRECWGLGGRKSRGGPGKCERCGREWRPLLSFKNARSFGRLRYLMITAPPVARPMTYAAGITRFGFDKDGAFVIEALTGGTDHAAP